jgi:hypothetical protein
MWDKKGNVRSSLEKERKYNSSTKIVNKETGRNPLYSKRKLVDVSKLSEDGI